MTLFRRNLAWVNPEDQSFPEPMNWDETLAQVRAVKSLGTIPLVVLARGPDSQKSRMEWASTPVDLIPKLEQVWQDLQKELAALSSDSQLIVAKNSGHSIQNDEPQLVIDAILGLVDKARK